MTLTVFDELEQGADAWIEARAGLVTASTVKQLLTGAGKIAQNETSRGLVEKLALERITGRVQYMPPTFDMQRGTLLEADARAIYHERYNPVYEVGFGRIDDNGIAYGASPDGLTVDGHGGLEIKCPKPATHFRTILESRVPPMYLPQIHMNMLVFDKGWWDFMSHDPGQPPFVKHVRRDAGWESLLLEAIRGAEAQITALLELWEDRTGGIETTPFFDPFNIDEEITF